MTSRFLLVALPALLLAACGTADYAFQGPFEGAGGSGFEEPGVANAPGGGCYMRVVGTDDQFRHLVCP